METMIRLCKEIYVLTRNDQFFGHYDERLDIASLEALVGDDGRASVLMAGQRTNFDLVEGDAVKSGPGRQCINGLFEPSLGSASAYHFHRVVL